MTTKLMDNNRRAHAAKVLAKASRKHQEENEGDVEVDQRDVEVDQSDAGQAESQSRGFNSLNDQYLVIREDILKLREDLAHGYDLLKEFIETKVSIRTLLKAK